MARIVADDDIDRDFADFGTDPVWRRRRCGFRIQRRDKTSTTREMRVIANAVFSTKVRTGGLTLASVYSYLRGQSFFSTVSAGVTIHLRDINGDDEDTRMRRTEGYGSLDGDLDSGDRFYGKGLQIDSCDVQDDDSGTSTVTVAMTLESAWEAI